MSEDGVVDAAQKALKTGQQDLPADVDAVICAASRTLKRGLSGPSAIEKSAVA